MVIMAEEELVSSSAPPSANRASSPSSFPTPLEPVQPDHFYPPSSDPSSSSSSSLRPDDDPLATRGIPVFKPSIDEFADFEQFMTRIEPWGMASGIVKVIPPREWTAALPDIHPQLAGLQIRKPIEQLMLGRSGVFRQQNMEKRREMTMRDWAEMCMQEDFRAPAVHEVGLKSAGENHTPAPKKNRKKRRKPDGETEQAEATVKDEVEDDASLAPEMTAADMQTEMDATPHATPDLDGDKATLSPSFSADSPTPADAETIVDRRRKRREALKEESSKLNEEFLESFDPHSAWLPPGTAASDYSPAFCSILERRYWRNVGFGRSAWYGADCPGSLFPSPLDPPSWNVGNLPSALTRLLPRSAAGLPGVNTPYLYFGMWRATFAWHVEDMDLFSINYIHFGAPKFWYAVPQGRAAQLENTLASHFPGDAKLCRQFLRHKSFLASPSRLAQANCKPNTLVQHAGEFVITYPRGYHAGFNLGLNCAESVNFALESWIELGKKAQACGCIGDSVRIDVEALLHERREEEEAAASSSSKLDHPPESAGADRPQGSGEHSSKKRKHFDANGSASVLPKKRRKDKLRSGELEAADNGSSSTAIPKVLLKVFKSSRKNKENEEPFPCCLCVSRSHNGLLRVHSRPRGKSGCTNVPWKEKDENGVGKVIWRAHEYCARIVPETWVDEWVTEEGSIEKMVFGVDAIVKDRWHLKCAACQKTRDKAHGAPIQCTRGKCPKAFHISCALSPSADSGDGDGEATIVNGEETEEGRAKREARIAFRELREVEKEVFLSEEPSAPPMSSQGSDHVLSSPIGQGEFTLTSEPPSAFEAAEVAKEKEKHFVPYAVLAPFEPPDPTSGEPQLTQAELDEIKLVKKIEYELFCTKHNPVVMAEKRQSRYSSTLQTLISLPPMSRIFLRTSQGVFEVSLCSVDGEKGTLEVLWDGGQKRAFASSAVVMKSENVVGSKPSVAPPDWFVPAHHSRALPSATATGTATPATTSTTPFLNPVPLPTFPSEFPVPSPSMNVAVSNPVPFPAQTQMLAPGLASEQAPNMQSLMGLRVCAMSQAASVQPIKPSMASATEQHHDIDTNYTNDSSSSSSEGISTPPAFAIDPSLMHEGSEKVPVEKIEMEGRAAAVVI